MEENFEENYIYKTSYLLFNGKFFIICPRLILYQN